MQRIVFRALLKDIDKNIDPKYKEKYNLYPYGSITEFLGGIKSDIDVYLDIRQIKEECDKIAFLENLRKTIEKVIKASTFLVISSRLCVIKFKYKCYIGQSIDFDISLMGLCPYLHSILLRGYALMDSRFSLLAISLKKFIELIGIKSSEYKIDYLNTFSWMILLISFLQDIIKPKILPKILSYNNNSIKNYKIPYGKNKPRNKFIDRFVKSIKEENTSLPDSLFDKKLLTQIYKEQISEKNNLSCAEIFLNFIEFIIFYFKSDSVYVNCSIEDEGYEPMYYILNVNEKIELSKRDERYSEYFKNKYCKFKNPIDNKKIKDGIILIRDPIDPHYNPAQTLKSNSYNTFIDNLKKGYLELLRNGDLLGLKINFKQD